MKKYLFTIMVAAVVSCSQNPEENTSVQASSMLNVSNQNAMSFYDFSFKTLDGEEFSFSSLKGKRVLIVNTASKCGYTGQYEDLQKLYSTYGGEKFEIIGFPANNFGKQEPGSNTEIAEFCQKNYGVTFLMMEKSSVKGDDINPVYKWLTSKSENGVSDANVKWNFHKFLIDENGKWVAEYSSGVSPMDEKIKTFASGK